MVQKQAIPDQAQNKNIPIKTQPPSVKKPLQKTFVKKSVVQTKPQTKPVVKTRIKPIKTKEKINLIEKITPEMFEKTKKQVPTNVKVVSILHYIFVGIFLLGGIMLFFVSAVLTEFLGGGFEGFLGTLLWWIFPIVVIALAVLFFFIARGLFKLQKWTRIVAVIFSILGILLAIGAFIQTKIIMGNIIPLIITGYIFYVLLINKKSRQAFS